MKDIIISGRRVRIELFTLLGCLIVAIGMNIYAIVAHNASLTEAFTSLGYVAVLTIVLYGCYTLIRLLIYPLLKLFKRKK